MVLRRLRWRRCGKRRRRHAVRRRGYGRRLLVAHFAWPADCVTADLLRVDKHSWLNARLSRDIAPLSSCACSEL